MLMQIGLSCCMVVIVLVWLLVIRVFLVIVEWLMWLEIGDSILVQCRLICVCFIVVLDCRQVVLVLVYCCLFMVWLVISSLQCWVCFWVEVRLVWVFWQLVLQVVGLIWQSCCLVLMLLFFLNRCLRMMLFIWGCILVMWNVLVWFGSLVFRVIVCVFRVMILIFGVCVGGGVLFFLYLERVEIVISRVGISICMVGVCCIVLFL